jgi:hypothetical protein
MSECTAVKLSPKYDDLDPRHDVPSLRIWIGTACPENNDVRLWLDAFRRPQTVDGSLIAMQHTVVPRLLTAFSLHNLMHSL